MAATRPEGAVTRTALEVSVRQGGLSDGHLRVSGWICGNPASTPHTVFFCLPGGMCRSAAYFDLRVPGHPDYSMAEWLAQRGALVLGMDHLGTGDSSRVADPFGLTVEVCAEVAQEVLSGWRTQLATGTLVDWLPQVRVRHVVGVGHSMGGLVAIVMQARYDSFAALANLGHAGDDWAAALLTEHEAALSPTSRRASVEALARARHDTDARTRPGPSRRLVFNADDVPAAVRQAVRDLRTDLLPTVGLTSMLPGAADSEKTALSVPLFLAFGELDHSRQPHRLVGQYPRCPSVHLEVLAGSGHNHNQSSRRHELWTMLARWTDTLRT